MLTEDSGIGLILNIGPGPGAVVPHQQFVAENKNGDMDLPEGAARFAVKIDGSESFEDLAVLKSSEAVFAMLEVRHAGSQRLYG
eukprot:scaffold109698_cov22-Prasinocladus_malaysianus.AAC.1